jgi:hypothetical protein
MQPPVANEERRRQVLELRQRHSFSKVAELTGLPVGTVKAIASRSGAFRDNQAHRELFSLPPLRPSAQTLPAVPELPPPQRVTGDEEVDAVLWLRSVINTGQAALIAKAREAAKRIKTPLKELERRYTQHLVAANPGNMFATFAAFGFDDLEGLATKAIKREALRVEGFSRFGDALFDDTPAEAFCLAALAGLELSGCMLEFDKGAVASRFRDRPELMPHTLTDCLHEFAFWNTLYSLRRAASADFGDSLPEVNAREYFVFGLMGQIRPRSKAEAVAVFRFMADEDRMGWSGSEEILLNLVGGAG